MIRSIVRGFGAALPKRVLTNAEMEQIVDTSDDWIVQGSGIRQRYIAGEGETTASLGEQAARAALANAGLTPDDLDLIIVATSTPDNTFPATAVNIQNRLGMHHGFAFDVQAVCTGFVYAVTTADAYIRGGLAKRSFQITERLKSFEPTFDRVFNFRALLIKAPSGLLIEPPIVRESLDATTILPDGSEAAVADQILQINKQAKIVTAPRDWRSYLTFNYQTDIPPPPRVLWPKNRKEQLNWNEWVKQGWDAGYEQGELIFESNLARLSAEYSGMVRYRTLLAEGKISQPYALQEDRGITGGKNEMRVGDRALRITGPSQFLTGADLWKPADR